MDRWFSALSSSERERAARIICEQDHRVWVIGRAMLRALLGAYLDRSPSRVVLTHGALGKPRVAPSENASGVEFSVAHSEGRILYAFARRREVGVDVERVRTIARMSSVARAILTRDEWRTWSEAGDRQRVDAFFRAWVRKEAVLKGLGAGLSVRPSRIAVMLERGHARTITLPAECGGQRDWRLLDVRQTCGWATALALEGAADATLIHASVHGFDVIGSAGA